MAEIRPGFGRSPGKAENAAGPGTSDARTNSTLSTENRAIPAEADAEVARTDGEPSTERLTALAAPWRYTVRDGKKIGEHNGAHFYTIGQRKGLGIGGRRESLFILATDTAQNVIYVGEGDSHPGLWRPALHIAPGEIHWVNPARALSPGQSARFSIRIRYRQPLQDATLFMRDQGAYILFDQPPGASRPTVRRMVRRRRAGRFGRNLRMTAFPQPPNAAACRTPEKHRKNIGIIPTSIKRSAYEYRRFQDLLPFVQGGL
ncbi:MAG: tRNA methyl transferase PRC-barrel domain-containing protein [Alistipes finegoldii]